ncbi:MAG: GntR family transcriptional regulator [Kiloniellales bacterium]
MEDGADDPGPSERLKRKTASELVAEKLRKWIIDGRLADGEQLRQDAIARQLGVSRIPVREALNHLEAEGLVTLVSHKGAVVTTLSTEVLSEFFDIRVLLETWLLGLAVPRMEPDDLARAEALLDRMAQDRRIEDQGTLNWQFHEALYRPSQRQETLKILRRIHLGLDRYVRFQLAVTDGYERADREHREILECCRAGDTASAVHGLERHILGVKSMLLQELHATGTQIDR